MTEIEIADELYSLFTTLDNNLLILKERVKRIEDNKEERNKEYEGLYEAQERIKFVAQKLLFISNHVMPTNCQQKPDYNTTYK